MRIDTKTTTFFSIIGISYLVTFIIPLPIANISLANFLSMLFYYFIGFKSIMFYYLIFSLDVIRCFPMIYGIAENSSILFNTFFPETLDIPTIINITTEIWIITLYILAFTGTIINFLISRRIIKKLKLIKRLKGVV